MKGQILTYDQSTQTGIISGQNGERYTLKLDHWKSDGHPSISTSVDFMVAGSTAIEIYKDLTQTHPNPNVVGDTVNQYASDLHATAQQGVAAVSNVFNQLPHVQNFNTKREEDYKAIDWIIKSLKNAFNFDGRARRSEFAHYYIFTLLVMFVAKALASTFGFFVGGYFMVGLVGLILLVPMLSVSSRRLHDLNLSGWMQIVFLIPIVGFFFILYVMFSDSKTGSNQYGVPVK